MKRAVIVTVCVASVAGGGLSLADSAVRGYAESRVATELQGLLELSRAPRVELGGWPFTVRAAQRDIPSVRVSEQDFEIQGQSFSALAIRARDVDFDRQSVHIRWAAGVMELSGADLTQMISKSGFQEVISLQGGEITVERPGIRLTGTARTSLRDNVLRIVPSVAEIAPFSVPLPEVVPGMRYTSVVVQGPRATVTFKARDVELVKERLS